MGKKEELNGLKINVTCVQMQPELRSFQKNIETMCGLIEKTMKHNPQTNLIVFPALATSGYECSKDFADLAEVPSESESIRRVGTLAKEYGVHVVYGFPEKDEEQECLYNSAVLIDELGKVVGIYRKTHLSLKEKECFRAGDDYPVFQTAIGKIGILISRDVSFPEAARIMALKGAEVFVVPANWEKIYISSIDTKNQKDWDFFTRARALENCMYLISANRVGMDQTKVFFGRSNIISPTGEAIEELLPEEEGFISAELDFNFSMELRTEYYNFLEERRADTYLDLIRNPDGNLAPNDLSK